MSVPWTLPPPDRAVSPYTGYTRAHWIAVLDGLLDAASRHASPTGALICPPGRGSWSGAACDGLEGYARTFVLAAIRLAAHGGSDPTDLLPRYAAGLRRGLVPGHTESWPRMEQATRQTVVEAASLVIGLHLTRPWLWDELEDETRDRCASWLGGAFALDLPDNNWHLFRLLLAAFLDSVGRGELVDPAVAEADRARVEQFYVGDGWYRDGGMVGDAVVGDNFDHYCGWAMHTYPVLIDLITGPGPHTARQRDRLHRFLQDYQHLVGADGAPLHQGRSLIYRWAAAAAPWVGAVADATPLSPGRTRRLGSGMLRYFVDHGFTGPDGIPTLGWFAAEDLSLVQPYSAPASPFWLAKGFFGLLLPPQHPVWTAVEEPLPAEVADQRLAIPGPGWLATSSVGDGIVRVANHGSDNYSADASGLGDPAYSRFAYSTATAPVRTQDHPPHVADNHIGLWHPERGLTARTRIHRVGLGDRVATSWHEPVWPDGTASGATICTSSIPLGHWEIRVHGIDTPESVLLREFGWLATPGLTSRIEAVTPATARVGEVAQGSAFGPSASVPWLETPIPAGRSLTISAVGLGRAPAPAPSVDWFREGERVVVRVADLEVALPLDGVAEGA